MTEPKKYRSLVTAAIAVVVFVIGWIAVDHFSKMGPGDLDVARGDNQFMAGDYRGAVTSYGAALKAWPDHSGAYIGLANSYTQMGRYQEALSSVNKAIEHRPAFGGYLATRGIILDHMGQHRAAMDDYAKALWFYPAAAKGMHWLDRFLKNIPKAPPTIRDRLDYLREEFKKPEAERVLRIPKLDTQQRPYQQ